MKMLRSALLACLAFSFLLASPALAAEANPWVDRAVFSLYASGAYKARIGDWAGAAVDFERAYRLKRESPEILTRLGEALFKLNRNAEAEKFAQRAIDEDSTVADAWYVLAEIALARDDRRRADSCLARRLEIKPDDIESRLKLGFIRELMGDMEGVVRAFSGYPSRRPGAAAAQFHLGVALVRLKRYEPARRAFREALRENPGYIEAAENVAIVSEEMEDDTAAIEAWENVLKIDPTRTEALRRKLVLLAELERYSEAISDLKRLLEAVPDKNGALRRLLAQLALQTGDLSTASQTLYSLAHRAGTETGYLEVALIASRAGTETSLVVASLDSAYQIAPRRRIGMMLVQALLVAHRDTEARSLLERLAAENESDTTVRWSLALARHRAGDETGAMRAFQSLVEIDSTNATALNYIGYSLAEQGIELDRAEEYIRRALVIDPENPQYIDSLGWIYYQRGMFDLARRYLERAWELMPEEPEIMEHLGDVYARTGAMAEALDLYRRALASEKAPRPDDLRRKISELEKCLPL